MSECVFTKDHEWLSVDGDIVTIGITEFAKNQLGDVVYVELPDVDSEISAEDEVAVIESVKAAAEIKAPLNGTVVEINEAVEDSPEIVSQDPMGEGWFFKLQVDGGVELSDFLDAQAYEQLCNGE